MEGRELLCRNFIKENKENKNHQHFDVTRTCFGGAPFSLLFMSSAPRILNKKMYGKNQLGIQTIEK